MDALPLKPLQRVNSWNANQKKRRAPSSTGASLGGLEVGLPMGLLCCLKLDSDQQA